MGAFIAIPLIIELTRPSMNSTERDTASGQFAQLSQGITHYEWFGPKRGPIVVCIHGLTTPSIVWGSLSKGLALMGCRVLTYDLYGRGYSDRPRGKQNEAFFTQQLNELLRHEDITDTISIVGYSMGVPLHRLLQQRSLNVSANWSYWHQLEWKLYLENL